MCTVRCHQQAVLACCCSDVALATLVDACQHGGCVLLLSIMSVVYLQDAELAQLIAMVTHYTAEFAAAT